MKLVFRWEDRNQPAPASADIYWTRDMLVEDLEYPDAPAVHRFGQGRIDAGELDEELRGRIERELKAGNTSGREQIIEMPNLDAQLQYLGSLAWTLVGETRKEQSWIATKMRSSNPGAPRVKLRLSNHQKVEPFEASDLQSFAQAYRGAWQRFRARVGPWPGLVMHIERHGRWYIITSPGITTMMLVVPRATPAQIEQYWVGVLEALEFFARADAKARADAQARAHAGATPSRNPKMTVTEAYGVLGLEPGASADTLRATYRALVKKHHPDRGGDLETMKRINDAHDVIERGGPTTATTTRSPPPHDTRTSTREDFWWRPKPSGNYTAQDLRRVADWVLSMGLRQVFYRGRVDTVPVDARFGNNTYTRPFGSVAHRAKIPDDIEADRLADAFERYHPGDPIFDIGMTKDLAWITWSVQPRGYQSVSFERPAAKRPPKPKGTGMTQGEAADIMRELGLRDVAGGTKYGYWSLPIVGRIEKTGIFVRTSKRTLRLVKRVRKARGIEDDPLDDEVYYGELTRAQLEEWAQRIRTQPAQNPSGKSSFTGFDVFEDVEDAPEPERSGTGLAFRSLQRDDIVTVGKTKWKVVRVDGSAQALVYKHPSKGKKMYMIQGTDRDDLVEVYEINGMGERLATVTTGPLRAAST